MIDAEIVEHRIKLLPKQRQFLDAKTRFKMYSGSRAAGKSYGLGADTYEKARFPNTRIGLYRMNYIDLVGSTLVTLLEGDGLMPPIIPPNTYTHNQQKHRIDIHNGGTIVYGGFDKGISAKEVGGTGGKSSLNLTAANVDEAVEVPESLLMQLDGAVRIPHPRVEMQIGMACNPGSPTHYLARRFGLSLDHVCQDEHFAVRTNIYDNFMLDERFVRNFPKSLSGVALMRYVWGLWVGSDGVVYKSFSRDTHVMHRDDYEPRRIVYGVDLGTNDPFVILHADVLPDGGVHLVSEHYERGLSDSQQVEALADAVGDSEDECMVDCARKGVIMDMRHAGINAIGSVKGAGSVMRGVGVVDARLRKVVNGVPMLTMDPSCVKTIAEFETYEYKSGLTGLKDEPKDQDNHCMDALRYLLERIDGVGGSYVSDPIDMDGGAGVPDDPDLEIGDDEMFSFDQARQDPRWGIQDQGGPML